MCATGSDALRNACYAVASGAFDVAMAIGVEKLKDSGFSGLVGTPIPNDGTLPDTTAPARFSFLAPAYAAKYGVDEAELKEVLTRIAWKNHFNGARNPRAQFRKEVSKETIARRRRSPACSASSTARACRTDRPRPSSCGPRTPPLHRQAAVREGAVASWLDPPAATSTRPTTSRRFPEVVATAEDAYAQAGVHDPRAELAMAEVHDCFTPTELVLMEDLGFADRGTAWKEVLAGTFDLDGDLPVNPDGGLKAFGHPIGASGLRMMFECWLQLRGEAPEERRIATVDGRPHARPDPQPRRSARRVRELHLGGRHRAERLSDPMPDADNVRIGAAYAAAMRAGRVEAIAALTEPDAVVWHNFDGQGL